MDTSSACASRKLEMGSRSRRHAIDAAMERRSYTRFIRRLGKTLRLPQQPTIAAATLLCHRFFLRQSHAKNDSLLIASACLFLASKSEDTLCRLVHIAAASYNLRIMGARPTPKNFFLLEDQNLQRESERRILLAEHLVLCTLGFELELKLPYKTLFSIIRMLSKSLVMQKELIKLGERQLKSHREGKGQSRSKLDQTLDECAMGIEESASKHRNARCGGVDTMGKHVGTGYVVAQNNANGKSRQPVPTNNACAQIESAFAQSRAAIKCLENDKTSKQNTLIAPDHMYSSKAKLYAKESLQTQYLREGEKAFYQVAWNFVNDALLSLICLQLKPYQIAAGAVWLAAKFLGVKFPSEGEIMPWWKEMKITLLEMEEIGNQFLKVDILCRG